MTSGRGDPWSVLGLPHGEQDAKAIRRAYAARLREHTPEDDPTGFRAVRDAYETLTRSPAATLGFLARQLKGQGEGPGSSASWSDAADESEDDEDNDDDDDEGNDTPEQQEVADASLLRLTERVPADTTPSPAPPEGAPLPPPAPPEHPIEPGPSTYSRGSQPEERTPTGQRDLPPAPRSATKPVPPDRGIPPSWVALLDAALTRAPGATPDPALVAGALASIGAEALAHPAGPAHLAELLQRTRPRHEVFALAEAFPPALLRDLLERNETAISAWLHAELVRAGHVEALARLCVALAQAPERLGGGAARWEAVWTACAAAPLVPNAARKLVDGLWREATPQERRRLPTELAEERIAVGNELTLWAAPSRALLAHALLPIDDTTPLSPADQARLVTLVRQSGVSETVRGVLREHLPNLAWPPPPKASKAPTSGRRSRGDEGEGTGRSWWSWIGWTVLAMILIRGCTKLSSTGSKERTRTGSQHERLFDELLERDLKSLPPLTHEQQVRLEALREKQRAGRLTQAEGEELATLENRILLARTALGRQGLSEEEHRRWLRLAMRELHGPPLTPPEQAELKALRLRRAPPAPKSR